MDSMSRFLVLYGTDEGQTAKVATRIGDVLTRRGHDVTVICADGRTPDLAVDSYDAILVGASIHVGKHQPEILEFVRDHRGVLAERPTAFFQVSLSSATEEGQAQAAGYVDAFIDDTGWHPDRIGLFGGALRYSEYGFLKRLLMKQIAKRQLPGAETGEDVEFTDWYEVEAFAADVATFVEGRLGITPPASDSAADDS